jgi:diguanylate cyclase (GGDEF)-like protein
MTSIMSARTIGKKLSSAPSVRAHGAVANGAMPPAPDDAHRLTSFLQALPHPAAVFAWSGTQLETLARNCDFTERFENARPAPHGPRSLGSFDWRARAGDMFSAQRRSDRFEVELEGALGISAYSCTLNWIDPHSDGRPLLLITATDRTSERKVESTLRRELLSDSLTGLPNRIGFVEEAEHLIEVRRGESEGGFAVVAIDLVRFSRINESLGALAGDELLITVARRIKSVLRAGDTLARIGGNEFAILSRVGHGLADVLQVVDRVRRALDAPFRLSTYLINIESAIGCALGQAGDPAADAENIIRQSQAAVKRAKRSRQLEIYRAHVLNEALKRFNMENRLREAIEEGRLHLAFQPLVHLQTGEVRGFEALARWKDDELGIVPPNDFIPVAEESGLIVPLGRWAMAETALTLASWDRKYGARLPVMMNVNLSPVQMTRDDVPRAVEEALRIAGIDGKRLTIELTESALISDPAKTRQLLGALQAMDVSVAMDDFGTGYSNLASLQSLPIDVLKIDRSFVTDMIGDPDKIAIVRAIISLAGALGMRTTAEGIETEEMAVALARLGSDLGQGYFYARPLTPEDAYEFWASRSAPRTS